MPDLELDALLHAVLATSKYRSISADLIRDIGAQELSRRSSWKQAVKATKSRLHQVTGAYAPSPLDVQHAESLLFEAAGSTENMKLACRNLMQRHMSTRERLPILETFFTTILADLPSIQSVVDVACGLNPLARPWMPFEPGTSYSAYDVHAGAISLVQTYFKTARVSGLATVRDVVANPPEQHVDLVFMLKTLPCLEHLGKTAVDSLLDAVDARFLLISYPVASLGGRNKGMAQHYERQFVQLARRRGWTYRRFQFDTELAFLVGTTVK